MAKRETSNHVAQVDISLNEPICASTEFALDREHVIRISTREDIVAEKLRALLQQPLRNRRRKQDVLDIAFILQNGPIPDPGEVARFLQLKSASRDVTVSHRAFHDPEIARRAQLEYDTLEPTARHRFIPFDEAWDTLIRFVDELPL